MITNEAPFVKTSLPPNFPPKSVDGDPSVTLLRVEVDRKLPHIKAFPSPFIPFAIHSLTFSH